MNGNEREAGGENNGGTGAQDALELGKATNLGHGSSSMSGSAPALVHAGCRTHPEAFPRFFPVYGTDLPK